MTRVELDAALRAIEGGVVGGEALVEISGLLEAYLRGEEGKKARERFMPFVKAVWPGFIEGAHHNIMARAFERIAAGELKRLAICLPPRHTKSEFGSTLLPAWFLGRYPNRKVIQASNTAELAVHFGRKVRNLIASSDYQRIFPGTQLRKDDKAAGRWATSQGGEYFAIGVGGTVTGRGADLLIIDDPHSEQEALLGTDEIYAAAYDWYTSGPRQRLQPGGAIVIINTRWGKLDLLGRILQAEASAGTLDQWEVIEFPAILPSGRALWPEFWPIQELEAIRNSIPVRKWMAQYQQRPTSDEAAIVKREWWKIWPKADPPKCDFIIQSWDTAYTAKKRNDHCACTTWGMFWTDVRNGQEEGKISNLILLDGYREQMEFPRLKELAVQFANYWKPDVLLIEAKSAGLPLIQELRLSGIPVTSFTPVRGNDKVVRVNSIADIIRDGRVWIPSTRWAEEMVEEFASMGSGGHDDLMDSATQAIMHFRHCGLITLSSDNRLALDEDDSRKRIPYYSYY